MKVSIVIPIYNGEKYIKSCLETIMNQTYKNIEIILVDDGSRDRSLNICNELSKKDSRIKVISQKNLGVSAARNRGILESTGEAIGFVDVDDVVDLEMYSKLVELLVRHNVDISVCGVRVVRDNQEDRIEGYNLESNVPISDIYKNTEQFHQVCGAVWQCLYRSTLIKENKIKFEEDITLGEDSLFNFKAIKFAKNIVYIDEPLYTYIHYKESAVRGYRKSYWNEIVKLKETKIKYLEELEIKNKENINKVNIGIVYNIVNYIKMVVTNLDRKDSINIIKDIQNDNLVKEITKLDVWKESNLKSKILILLLFIKSKYIIYYMFDLMYGNSMYQ